MPLEPQILLAMYRQMLTIRRFEERALELYQDGKIYGIVHPYLGEEAIAVGVCSNLRPDDYLTSTHRGHGHCLAKGGDMRRMIAELMGRQTGYCKGKGGSMHVAAIELGVLGANGVGGGGFTIAVGSGLSARARGTDQVTVCFFGDGASNQGGFHEAANMAGIWKLPVLFVCENNGYAMSTQVSYSTAVANISDRAAGYDMPGVTVDGNDVLAVYEAAAQAGKRARSGEGPTLIEAKTYNWYGHSVWDRGQYRPKEEVASWRQRDPIARLQRQLEAAGILDAREVERIEEGIASQLDEAVQFALASPVPDAGSLLADVYARGDS